VNLADTATHVRLRSIAATLTALLLAGAAPAAAANTPGGTSAPGTTAPAATTPVPKPSVSAHVTSVRIIHARCTPAARCSTNPHQVSVSGTLLIQGVGLTTGMVVAFPKSAGATISRNSPAAHLRASRAGLIVTVPVSAHSGRIKVLLGGGRYTSSYGPIYLFAHALHPPAPPAPAPAPAPATQVMPSGGVPSGTALDGQGMWIWYLSQSDGGSVAAIVAQAHAAV
jgi:hypothetical protein